MHRILWCDGEANGRRLSTVEGVRDLVGKASRASIDTLIVDVKPLVGEVLYQSSIAPRLSEARGFVLPDSYDLLRTVIAEAHPRGLEVHAGINVFSEGRKGGGRGPAYQHPEWQTVLHEATREVRLSDGTRIRIESVNPSALPDTEGAIYASAGASIGLPAGRTAVSIVGQRVIDIFSGDGSELRVPEDGCILVLPPDISGEGIHARDIVRFRAEPVLRPAQDSRTQTWGVFVNPIGPARSYELEIIHEIVSGYDIDGIIFDRMRYPNLFADFSPTSQKSFEEWLGNSHINWPEDVYRISDEPWCPPIRGKHYKEWLEWRAANIHDFAQEAVSLVHRTKPSVKAGVYVGSWYDSYYDVGVNWASRGFHAGYEWMTEKYNETGFAEMFDYICTGCYYPQVTREDARVAGTSEGATVEAACELSRLAIGDAAPVFGGLFLHEYAGNPEMFPKAVKTAQECSDGVMLFDLVHLEEHDWWTALASVK